MSGGHWLIIENSAAPFFYHALVVPPTMFVTFLLGFPWYFYPLPITAAYFLVNFYLHKHLKVSLVQSNCCSYVRAS